MLGPSSWLEHSAQKWPNRDAIFDQDVTLRFEELHHAALGVARWLSSEAEAGDRVAIALPFGVPGAVFYFGALFSGMIAVPIDPLPVTEQLHSIMEDIDPIVVIGSSGSKHHLEARRFYPVDDYDELRELVFCCDRDKDLPSFCDDPSRIVNVVYTSGSTGQPKGVMLNQGNLEAVIRGIERVLVIHEKNRIFTSLPFGHTYGLSQLWLMARTGATLGVIPDITRMANIRRMIITRKMDTIAGVPYHFALLTRRGHKEPFHGVKKVTIAGDTPSKGLIEKIRISFPNAAVYVMYGLTEATTRLTILPAEDLARKGESIGLPIDGVELKLIGDKGEELDPHQAGELVARGPNITPGYWKDEELTRRVIVNGWLHTGDIVRRDEEGYFYHLGRKDFAFKSGGEKIIPAAIEKVLREIEGVQDAAVLGREDFYRGNTICAVIVKRRGSNLTPRTMISICQGRLGRLWVPDEVVFASEIPRTSTGKIRYDTLRKEIL